jgi:hypothetical protein
MQLTYPFQNTGVDFTGAFNVVINGEEQELFVVLFTCLVFRAVHLEIAWNNTAKTFVHCFRRFIARRGTPTSMLSDNAPNFQLAHKIIRNKLGCETIAWKFTTPHAPWQGGVYERLIRPLKIGIRASMGKAKIQEHDFCTLVTEIEWIINNRPLTNLSESEPTRPLTPIDVLLPLGHRDRESSVPEDSIRDPEYLPKVTSKDNLIRSFDKLHLRINRFYKVWLEHYLLALKDTQAHKWTKQGSRIPDIGDVVLIYDEQTPPYQWETGIVEKLSPDDDGIIRSVFLRTRTRKRLKKAIKHLYPQEIKSEETIEYFRKR